MAGSPDRGSFQSESKIAQLKNPSAGGGTPDARGFRVLGWEWKDQTPGEIV